GGGARAGWWAGRRRGAGALGGVIARAGQGGKTAVGVAGTASPEPLSNIALSLGEDALAGFITWLATRHPLWATAIVIGLLTVVVVVIRAVVRALASLFRGNVGLVARD